MAKMDENGPNRAEIEEEGRKLWRMTYHYWWNVKCNPTPEALAVANLAYADYIEAFS
jgi:hypothetical protein